MPRPCSLILLNGGVGARIAAGRPKQLLKLRGIPILVYSLVVADRVEGIEQIVLNHPSGFRKDVEELLEDYAFSTPIDLVEGGPTRHASVATALGHCRFDDVLIHEAARPFVQDADFEALIASEHPDVALMSEIPFTVAPVDPESGRVTGSLDRSRLRNVQLPQRFSRAHLEAAHADAARRGVEYTEDATLVADSGVDVRFIPGHDDNLKLTTPGDLRLATALLALREDSDA